MIYLWNIELHKTQNIKKMTTEEIKALVLKTVQNATIAKKNWDSVDISTKLQIRADYTMEALRSLIEERKVIKRKNGANTWYQSL